MKIRRLAQVSLAKLSLRLRASALNYFPSRLHERRLNTMNESQQILQIYQIQSAFIRVHLRPVFKGAYP
jgi:hypothetical protein